MTRAKAVGAAVAAAAIVATMAWYGPAQHVGGMLRFVASRQFVGGWLFASIFAVGGWWTVSTWKQLWRKGRSKWEILVYDHGVRGFGLGTAACQIGIFAYLGRSADPPGPFAGPMTVAGALAGLFFGVPVCLHLGHYWGRRFAQVMGIEHDPTLEVGEPPPWRWGDRGR